MTIKPETQEKILAELAKLMSTPECQFMLIGSYPSPGGAEFLMHVFVPSAPKFAETMVSAYKSAVTQEQADKVFQTIAEITAMCDTANVMMKEKMIMMKPKLNDN